MARPAKSAPAASRAGAAVVATQRVDSIFRSARSG
jgi:hypothetical protein